MGLVPKGDGADWKDYGTPTHRESGCLRGVKGMLSVLETVDVKDTLVRCASARSEAEAT